MSGNKEDFWKAIVWGNNFFDQASTRGGCLVWTGNSDGKVNPPWNNAPVSVQSLAFQLYFDRIPRLVTSICGNSFCIKRGHLVEESFLNTDTRLLWQTDFRLREAYHRFWIKVKKPTNGDNNGCWLWKAAVLNSGFGVFKPGKECSIRATTVHRLAYEMKVGEIPPGHDVQQSCHNTLCVNPSHLFTEPHGKSIKSKYQPHLHSLKDQLMSQVEVKDSLSCWPWRGTISNTPIFMRRHLGKDVRINAIEAVYILSGRFIDKNKWYIIKQSCGNEICCNPSHINIFYTGDLRIKRILSNFAVKDEHWIYNPMIKSSYKQPFIYFKVGNEQVSLYNLAYQHFLKQELPEGYWAYPACDTLFCINPEHLGYTDHKTAKEIITKLRFWSMVHKTEQCWEWTGKINPDGLAK